MAELPTLASLMRKPLAWVFVVQTMAACASVPSNEQYENDVAYLGGANEERVTYDARTEFRSVFCAVAKGFDGLVEADSDCAEYLWRLEDERAETVEVDLPPLDPALRVFIVGGAFADCLGSASIAYQSGADRLSAAGARITIVPIGGRSSADFNASRIAETYAEANTSDDDLVIMIGYSKGAVDILHFLARYPATSRTVDAIIGVSGPLQGSEAARRGAWIYDKLFMNSFAGMCDPGDGGVVDSLVPEYRQAWLREHRRPEHVRYYMLSAFTTRENMARGLMPTYRTLARVEPRNDGQVSIRDGLLPDTVLLGYANADHWSLALDMEGELGFIAARRGDRRFPRDVLLEALLRFVSEDARQAERSGRAAVSPER